MKLLWLVSVLSTAVVFAAHAKAPGDRQAIEHGGVAMDASMAAAGGQIQVAQSSGSEADRRLLREIQERLVGLGYDPGPADGLMGWQTRQAIRKFQGQAAIRVDGEPSEMLLNRLRDAAAAASRPRRGDRRDRTDDAQAAVPDLEQLVRQMTRAIRDAERQRRAEPAFLAELTELLRPYKRPERRQVLGDDFSDGDFTANPSWTVANGDFKVSRRHGLESRVEKARERRDDRPEDVAAAVLSQILTGQQARREPEAQPEAAEIFTRAEFSNDFTLKASVRVRSDSICDLGIFDAAGQGYFLSLSGGRDPVLMRKTGGRTEIIGRNNIALPDASEATYDIEWTRQPDGDMRVQLTQDSQIRANDQALSGNFQGVVHSNRFGQCALRSISVVGRF